MFNGAVERAAEQVGWEVVVEQVEFIPPGWFEVRVAWVEGDSLSGWMLSCSAQ